MVHIMADRRLVFQMLSAIGQGQMPGSEGSSKVLEREGDRIVAEFHTPVKSVTGTKVYRTVEEVYLYPEERITFRGLEGPMALMEEEFLLEEDQGCTDLHYSGTFAMGYWIFGWLVARFYVKRMLQRVVREHMLEIKGASEARASRSKVFANACDH